MDTLGESAIFGLPDVGCFADDCNGHGHIRGRLADLVEAVSEPTSDDAQAVITSLRGDMPDDAWDEDEALEILESHTSDSVAWAIDGGLCLFAIGEFED